MRSADRLSFFVVLALSAATLAGCPSDPSEPLQPPAAPTGLTAAGANGAVSLSWAPVSGATSYTVYRATATGALASKSAVASTGATAINDPAANDTTYFYQVTAVNAAGESAGSNEATATPSASALPAAPTGVKATAGDGSVTLTWDAVPGATSYVVYWDTTPGVTTLDGSFACTGSPCTKGSLVNGTIHYFAVSALISASESPLSTEVTATPSKLPYIKATAMMLAPGTPYGYGAFTVEICTSSACLAPVTDAVVTMGGVTLPYDAAEGSYEGVPASSIAGQEIALSVTIPPGGAVVAGTYSASVTMYTVGPRLLSPTAGAVVQGASGVTFTWTAGAPTTGSTYSVAAFGTGMYVAVVPPSGASEQSHTFASMSPGTLYMGFVMLSPIGGGIPIPNAAAGSTFAKVATSEYPSFTVQ